ncbi:PAS domain S-box protein, partial [Acinetobacter baumannii]
NDVRSLINKLKKSNELISESEKKYRYLFDHAPILIFIWDIETLTILEINELVKKSYGYSEEEWQKLTLPDIRPKEDRAHIMSIRQKFLDG